MNNNFIWSPKNLDSIDPVVDSISKELCKYNLIKEVIPHPTKENKVRITHARGICSLNSEKSTFIDYFQYFIDNQEKGYYYFSASVNGSATTLCKDPKCGYKQCPIVLGGYYKYLEQNSKLDNEDDKYIVSLDKFEIINSKKASLLERVNNLSTSEEVKNYLKGLIRLHSHTLYSRECGINLPRPLFNQVIIANEGTDKKEIHKLIRDILYSFGYFKSTKYKEINFEGNTDLSPTNITVIRNLKSLSRNSDSNSNMKSADLDKLENKRSDFIKMLLDNYKDHAIILEGTKDEVNEFLESNSKLKTIFSDTLTIPDPTNEEIFNYFKNLCNKYSYKLEDNFKNDFIAYLISTRKKSPYKNLDYADYLFFEVAMNAMEELQNNDFIIKASHLPSINHCDVSIDKEFSNIVGMVNIKRKLEELQKYLAYNMEISKYTDKAPKLRLHMLLTGPAGTGKTTVARIISKMLYSLGYTREDKVIESERKDFIAPYTGQTAIKTSRLIQQARGGVLFIDEAYALGQDDSFSAEAIATLIKSMEDYSDDLIVILAGYRKEMSEFLNINSGISSRIGYTFDFEDYSVEELEDILKRKLSSFEYTIEDEALANCKALIKKATNITDFGNGRFIDNLIQGIVMKHSDRLDVISNGSPSKEELFTLTVEDTDLDIDILMARKDSTLNTKIGLSF